MGQLNGCKNVCLYMFPPSWNEKFKTGAEE